MGDKTGIEWADATWNPVVGCSKVSPGCDNCYAIGVSARMIANPKVDGYDGTVAGGDWTGQINLLRDRLDQPLRWKRPRRIFVNSMSDLFHPDVPDEFINDVFGVMAKADWHQFQVLTKRPQRMREYFNRGPQPTFPPPNVWLGTSIESNHYMFRSEHLAAIPAAVRFLSLEPLLGPLPSLDLDNIDWVIVGGESGTNARPMHPEWVLDIRDRCTEANVPFFFKQWGEWTLDIPRPGSNQTVIDVHDDGKVMRRVGKKAAGHTLGGQTWNQYPKQRSP